MFRGGLLTEGKPAGLIGLRLGLLALCLMGASCGEPRPNPAAPPPAAEVPEPSAVAESEEPEGGRGSWKRGMDEEGAKHIGRWKARRRPARDGDEEIEALVAMGYADGSTEAPDRTGLLSYDVERASKGVNLYVSGQGPEAHLIDMNGEILHKWAFSFFDQWPGHKVRKGGEFPDHWRRAWLGPEGDLIVIWGGMGIARLDRDSKPIWAYKGAIHHDLEVLPDGSLWTLIREGERIDQLNAKRRVVMDSIVLLSDKGEVLRTHSVYDLVAASPFAALIRRWADGGDILHINTIAVLDGSCEEKNPAFKKGNLLISSRRTDTLLIVDMNAEKVVWALSGQWHAQHEPVLLDNCNVLLFDNRGMGKRSRVIEIDPLTQQRVWAYGEEKGQTFYSQVLGSVSRLPNGNTLITESDHGRAFEVTASGDVVWDFVNPFIAGPNGEYVASIYELVRLAPDTPLDWADPTTASLTVDMTRAVGR